MKLNWAQKIGLAGFAFVGLIALLFFVVGFFSPYIFTGMIPFSVLMLLGFSLKSKNNNSTS